MIVMILLPRILLSQLYRRSLLSVVSIPRGGAYPVAYSVLDSVVDSVPPMLRIDLFSSKGDFSPTPIHPYRLYSRPMR